MLVNLFEKKNEVSSEDIFLDNGLFNVKDFEVPKEDNREILSTVKNTGIENLFSESLLLSNRCVDYTVRGATTENIFFKDNGKFSFKPEAFDGFIQNTEISDFALGQICAKLGVPKKYVERCLKENPPLATENINSWLEDYGKDLFIRCCDDKIRGVLSSKYSTFDTPEILKSLMDSYDFTDFSVKGSYLSPERFHARIVMPRNLDIPMEDDLMPGIQIDSSDVGRSVLTVQFLIFKQVCTNGLVIPKNYGVLFSQKHIGISQSEFITEFKKSVQNLPLLIEHSEEFITNAKNTGIKVYTQEDMMKFVQGLQKSANIPEDSAKRVMNIVKSEVYGSPSRWTLINALTQEAQNFTLEKRIDVERYAGSLLVA